MNDEPFDNQLSDAQQEILAIFLEETSEANHIVGKILRHGLDSYNPHDNAKELNRDLLAGEVGDLLYAVHMLFEYKMIDQEKCFDALECRGESIGKYLHHCLPIYPTKYSYLSFVSGTTHKNPEEET